LLYVEKKLFIFFLFSSLVEKKTLLLRTVRSAFSATLFSGFEHSTASKIIVTIAWRFEVWVSTWQTGCGLWKRLEFSGIGNTLIKKLEAEAIS